MAIDEMMLKPMIEPYENMVKDCENKGLDNEDVDKLKAVYSRLVELGNESEDIMAFTGACMQENIYTDISDAYSRALVNEGKSANSGDPSKYDDASLLQQSVKALESVIEQIISSREQAKAEASKDPKANLKAQSEFASRFMAEQGIDVDASKIEASTSQTIDEELAEKPNAYNNVAEVEALDISGDIIPPIQDLIALGKEEGMTLPNFLRIQMERGLDKAMEGAGATKKALEYAIGWADASSISPHHINEANEYLEVFNTLAAKQEFNVPNVDEHKWASNDVEYKHEYDKIKWGEITDRWEDILDDLSFWALAHCSFAPWVDPWKDLAAEKKPPAILRVKDIQPGIIKQKERLLEKYFGISFLEIFEHPTFKWAVEKNNIYHSKEYVDFLKNTVYPSCIPCKHLPQDIITEKERLYNEKKEINPEVMVPAKRVKTYYDLKFGEGRYVSKFGQITEIESNAAPW